jgi:hypothetical protein
VILGGLKTCCAHTKEARWKGVVGVHIEHEEGNLTSRVLALCHNID